ncbi:MAG: agmatinase [Paracoccaceae bacterium]
MGNKNFFKPISGFELPRFAGMPTFMRLPYVGFNDDKITQVDIGIIGAPWDAGTTNRPGPRHGPRQVRDMSTMIRAQHGVSNLRPFDLKNCADLGDVAPNPASLEDSLKRFENYFLKIKELNILPLTVGGDHLCSLPILRSLAKNESVGLIQFDSHTDLFHSYFDGQMYTHGTPFRRAVEQNLIDPKRTVQVGIRGTNYDSEDRDFALSEGIRIITIEEFFERGISDVISEVKSILGDKKTYLSYDIDFIDPAFAPGTGTPEVGGPNSFQALEVIRKLSGINLIGADVVEISPPFDNSGGTAFLGSSILFEILCIMVS